MSTVEYVILLVLIAALSVATWRALGGMVKERLVGATGEIDEHLSGEPGSPAQSDPGKSGRAAGGDTRGVEPGNGTKANPGAAVKPRIKRKIANSDP